MHSSRMRSGCSLTVCWCLLPGEGGGGSARDGGVCSRGVSGPGGGVSSPGGVSAPGGSALGGHLVQGVASAGGGGWYASMH